MSGSSNKRAKGEQGLLAVDDTIVSSQLPVEPWQADFQDCDSEALEALEDEAEQEQEDQVELDRLVDEAAIEFPEERIAAMLKDLKQIGLVAFLQRYIRPETSIPRLLIALGILLPKALRRPETSLPMLQSILKTALHRLLQRREKIPSVNTAEDALCLIRTSSRTIVLSGAGISTSCGIPDFRSKDGIYARLQDSGQYELDDPQDMFDKDIFMYKPEVFYSFAKDIYPSNFKPSASHRFIRLLEERGQLLRNYTQNIDTLEQAAGIESVLNCHGSFATVSCVTCSYKCPGAAIKEDIFAQRVPPCPECSKRLLKKRKRPVNSRDDSDDDEGDDGKQSGILKPDITFFGEKLSDSFDQYLLQDRSQADLLIIVGTSLKVAPVSSVVGHLPHSCPVILINRTPILHIGVDIMLLGDSDQIVQWLCKKLGWMLPLPKPDKSVVGEDSVSAQVRDEGQATVDDIAVDFEPERWRDTHIWLFPGAEPGPLLQAQSEDGSEDDEDNDDQEDEDDTKEGSHFLEPTASSKDESHSQVQTNGDASAADQDLPEEGSTGKGSRDSDGPEGSQKQRRRANTAAPSSIPPTPAHLTHELSAKRVRQLHSALLGVSNQLVEEQMLLERIWYKSSAQFRGVKWMKTIHSVRRGLERLCGDRRGLEKEGKKKKPKTKGRHYRQNGRQGLLSDMLQSVAHLYSTMQFLPPRSTSPYEPLPKPASGSSAASLIPSRLAFDQLCLFLNLLLTLSYLQARCQSSFGLLQAHLNTPPAPTFAPLVVSLVGIVAQVEGIVERAIYGVGERGAASPSTQKVTNGLCKTYEEMVGALQLPSAFNTQPELDSSEACSSSCRLDVKRCSPSLRKLLSREPPFHRSFARPPRVSNEKSRVVGRAKVDKIGQAGPEAAHDGRAGLLYLPWDVLPRKLIRPSPDVRKASKTKASQAQTGLPALKSSASAKTSRLDDEDLGSAINQWDDEDEEDDLPPVTVRPSLYEELTML